MLDVKIIMEVTMAKGGIAGIWLDEAGVLKAAKKTRDMGFKKFDAITPYPVHGMEEACGLKRSFIPYVAFVAGLIGCSFGMFAQYWTSAVNWPINVAGKPFFSAPAFIPITFEMTILFAALSSVSVLLIVAKLPKVDPPIIDKDLTCHKFAIYIPVDDVGYDVAKIEQMFRDHGAHEIKKVMEY